MILTTGHFEKQSNYVLDNRAWLNYCNNHSQLVSLNPEVPLPFVGSNSLSFSEPSRNWGMTFGLFAQNELWLAFDGYEIESSDEVGVNVHSRDGFQIEAMQLTLSIALDMGWEFVEVCETYTQIEKKVLSLKGRLAEIHLIDEWKNCLPKDVANALFPRGSNDLLFKVCGKVHQNGGTLFGFPYDSNSNCVVAGLVGLSVDSIISLHETDIFPVDRKLW